MEEKFEEKNNEFTHPHKHCMLKYLTIFLATLIGAFLAFYFATDITIKMMLSPQYQMKHAHKMMKQQEKMFNDMAKDINRNEHNIFVPFVEETILANPIQLKKEDNTYVITIDLKKFDINPNDINIEIDDNTVNISGEVKKEKRGKEKMMSFSQTYLLEDKIDENAITKKDLKNKYIITLPIKK